MIIISFLIGGMFGIVGMGLFSSNAYEKGWEDGNNTALKVGRK